MPVDRDAWRPPPLQRRHADGERVPGALNGSLLLDRPEHRAERDRIAAFVAAPGPLALEIGFDHGARILDHARRFPEIRWLGVEIRRARVEAAAPHAPDNALLARADGRTVLAALIPEHRLHYVYVLFPTPADDPRHLLVTPDLAASLARALHPEGRLHVATDVPAMFRWCEQVFAGWPPGDPVPYGPVLSRRERVCARDGLPLWRLTVRSPAPGSSARS